MNFIEKFFITRYLKLFLDKLPFNNRKTLLGLLLLLLTILQNSFPENPIAPIIQAIIEIIKNMGADDLQTVSIGVVLTGVVHKILKAIEK